MAIIKVESVARVLPSSEGPGPVVETAVPAPVKILSKTAKRREAEKQNLLDESENDHSDQEGDSADEEVDYDELLREEKKKDIEEMYSLLDELEMSTIDSYLERINQSFKKAKGKSLISKANLLPLIDRKNKVILLPKDNLDDKDCLIRAMCVMAKNQGLTVRLLPYDKKLRDISKESEMFALGISFAVLDMNEKILIKDKRDMIEMGKTYFRSLLCLKAFSSDKDLGEAALRKDQKWFGNDPTAYAQIARKEVKVSYIGDSIPDLFTFEDWARSLSQILKNLIREEFTRLGAAAVDHLVETNLIDPQQWIIRNCGRKTMVAAGKSSKILKPKITLPHKPNVLALFTKEENKIISDLIDPIFQDELPRSRKALKKFIITKPFATFCKEARDVYSERSETLSKLGALTTKRLNEFRNLAEPNKNKRKKDIGILDTEMLLISRESPRDKFLEEILGLDPNFREILKDFRIDQISEDPEKKIPDIEKSKEAVRKGINVTYSVKILQEIEKINQSKLKKLERRTLEKSLLLANELDSESETDPTVEESRQRYHRFDVPPAFNVFDKNLHKILPSTQEEPTATLPESEVDSLIKRISDMHKLHQKEATAIINWLKKSKYTFSELNLARLLFLRLEEQEPINQIRRNFKGDLEAFVKSKKVLLDLDLSQVQQV